MTLEILSGSLIMTILAVAAVWARISEVMICPM